ncbi:hypothetical protein BB558_007673 [Smittium angustum]|uniref:Inositol-phosphate phosphatase n=1 Tax=Smittium angustum TaxID=133377 RepID=A0A2U1IUG4_SMIAN|nr:hypothetical protein BB558_007673 [Smittium angustum]
MDINNLKAESLEFALYLATQLAGPTFLDAFWRRGEFESDESLGSEDKLGNMADCVTVADRLIEKIVFENLKTRFPLHRFVGEETTSVTNERFIYNNEPTWIVDPIDGTNNFVHHFELTGISIGLAINNFPQVGVIYMPVLDELYFGSIGNGAFLLKNALTKIKSIYPQNYIQNFNGSGSLSKVIEKSLKLPLYNPKTLGYIHSLSQCAILTEHGADRVPEIVQKRINTLHRLLSPIGEFGGCVQNLRFLGGSTMDLINIAKGSADTYFDAGSHVWDFSAGIILVLESGGAVFSGDGLYGTQSSNNTEVPEPKPFDIWKRSICAIRVIPDRTDQQGNPIIGSGKQQQKKIVNDLLKFVELIEYTPDGYKE